MQNIKTFLAVSLASMLAYFEPIGDILTSITVLFLLNFVFGLLAGLLAHRETFNFRKAFVCVSEASVYLLLLASTFFIGDHLGLRSGALQAVSTVTYTLLYFYSVNIFKNLKVLMPKSKTIAFLHYLISIQILHKIPSLNQYLKQQ